ncbi:MAG TPA: hypothetical protein PKY08_00305 [Candidatus Magasanikbacteria bacterium]|nr:hypothetical protein [Candidatus Magasanikbacteria bacterium]
MKKSLFLIPSFFLAFPVVAKAFCPVCTVAVGAGLGLSRWLGIDDTISGLWVGGLTASLIGWTINWLNSKKIKFRGRKILVTFLFYGLMVVPFYWMGIMGHPFNKLWGIDKLLLGIIFGSLFFLLAGLIHSQLKKNHENKSFFSFQRVVFPIGTLVILSLIFYFLTK